MDERPCFSIGPAAAARLSAAIQARAWQAVPRGRRFQYDHTSDAEMRRGYALVVRTEACRPATGTRDGDGAGNVIDTTWFFEHTDDMGFFPLRCELHWMLLPALNAAVEEAARTGGRRVLEVPHRRLSHGCLVRGGVDAGRCRTVERSRPRGKGRGLPRSPEHRRGSLRDEGRYRSMSPDAAARLAAAVKAGAWQAVRHGTSFEYGYTADARLRRGYAVHVRTEVRRPIIGARGCDGAGEATEATWFFEHTEDMGSFPLHCRRHWMLLPALKEAVERDAGIGGCRVLKISHESLSCGYLDRRGRGRGAVR